MLTPTGVTGVSSSDYIAAAKQDAPCHVRLTFSGENQIVFTDGDFEQSGIQYDFLLNGDSDLTFGRAVMAEFSASMYISGKTVQLVWENEFQLEIGMEVNGTTVWTTLGYFTGTRPDRVNSIGLIDFVAHDRMQRFDKLADDWIDSLTYPMTLAQIYASLCTFVGIQSESGDELSNIMSRSYTTAPIIAHGMTCRDILALIAGAAGCYARITPGGKVKLVWFQDHTDYEIEEGDQFDCQSVGIHFTNDSTTWGDLEGNTWASLEGTQWSDLEYYRQQLVVGQVAVKNTEDDIGVVYPATATTGNVYLIIDNPYLVILDEVNDVTNYVKPLYDRLHDFGGYLPLVLDCIGNPLVEAGDIISVEIYGEIVETPIFYKSMSVSSTCTDKYEVTGNIKREEITSAAHEQLTQGGKAHVFRNKINELYSEIFDSSGNSRIQQIPDQISLAVSKKATIYTQAYEPVDPVLGDFWIDTSNGNKIKKYSSISLPGGSVSYYWKNSSFDDTSKYAKQSGIDIVPDGVDIYGGRYVRIRAGVTGETGETADGVFDVDTANFKLSSTDKVLRTGNWEFDDAGIKCYSLLENDSYMSIGAEDESTYGMSKYMLTLHSRGRGGEQGPLKDISFCFISDGVFFPEVDGVAATSAMLGSPARPWFSVCASYYNNPSSRNVKHDIQRIGNVGDVLDALEPVSFVYNNDPTERKRFGLIHEDTVDILPEICIGAKDAKDDEKAINYVGLVPLLLKEVQDLRKRVASLEAKVESLERK